MSVRDCVVKLRKEGKLSEQDAASAIRLWERWQGRYAIDLPPARADAAAALQAARMLAASSKEQKASLALQVMRQADAEQRQMTHPRGASAGAMALLTRDIWEKGGQNVDTRMQTYREALYSKFNAAIEAYRSKNLGFTQDIAGAQNMVRELFGQGTGDATAQAAARGFTDAVEFAVARTRAAGKIFTANEDWRLPQFWDSGRVLTHGTDVFKTDVRNALAGGGLKIYDKERFEIASDPARIRALVAKAADDIAGEARSAPVFSGEMRTFLFQPGSAGADAFLALQGKYGAGNDILATLQGHLGRMAREMALADVLGPNHAATVAVLAENARRAASLAKDGMSAKARVKAALTDPRTLVAWLETPGMINRTYDVLTGRASGVESAMAAGILGAARSAAAAASLGSTIVPAIVGDSVTMMLASQHLKMQPMKVLGHTIDLMLRDNPHAQEEAARLLVTGHMLSDHAIGTVRYADNLIGPDLMKRVASTVIRASGLNAWTEAAKKAFTLEALGFVAGQTRHASAAADPAFQRFLAKAGIDAAEWDSLRARPLANVMGATYFDSSLAASDRSVQKLYEGILQERAFAVLEPDARIRAITTGGVRAGTWGGEFARNATLFKSFSMTMVATHLMRIAATDAALGTKAASFAWFFLLHVAAGAAIVQARQILTGKDPIDMHHPKFWFQSAMQGGGAGYYGDLISAAVEAGSKRSGLAALAGPIGGLIDDAAKLGSAIAAPPASGSGAAGQAIDFAHRWTPGGNLWFSRLATDRVLFDSLHRLADPHYLQSFQRKRDAALKAYGQQSWFGPGDTAPQRGPNLGAAIGR